MRTLTVFVGAFVFASVAAHAESAAPLARLPLQPGGWSVVETVGTTSTSEAFVRSGPGGKSLIVESESSVEIVTPGEAVGTWRLDRYRAASPQPSRLDGKLDGAALVFAGKNVRVWWTVDATGMTTREETGTSPKAMSTVSSRKWTRTSAPATPGHATGIGGVFMKANNSTALREWYHDHLGLNLAPDGWWIDIRWREVDDPARVARTVWATFKKESKHFDGPFMINYRVDNLDALLSKLAAAGVKPERTEDEPGNGRFAWIRDGEGNLVELWEPASGG
jgi:catechol 2,3-dioxygenase-like lactoylglutathione lyase family enzyme